MNPWSLVAGYRNDCRFCCLEQKVGECVFLEDGRKNFKKAKVEKEIGVLEISLFFSAVKFIFAGIYFLCRDMTHFASLNNYYVCVHVYIFVYTLHSYRE